MNRGILNKQGQRTVYDYEQVYNQYYDTAGNLHLVGVITGEHIIKVSEQTEPSGKRGEMMSQKEFDEMVHRVVLGQTEPGTDCSWK